MLPDTAKEKPQRGKVVSIGPGKLLDSGSRGALSVSVGDEVIYGKYSGTEIEVDGKDVKILRETRHSGQGRQLSACAERDVSPGLPSPAASGITIRSTLSTQSRNRQPWQNNCCSTIRPAPRCCKAWRSWPTPWPSRWARPAAT